MVPAVLPPLLRCGRCEAPLHPADFADGQWRDCPYCHTPVHLLVFPAFSAPVVRPVTLEPILEAGEASCFYHPAQRAIVPCDSCGRYLCDLCRVEWGSQTFCPVCVQAGQTTRKRGEMENRRLLYDSMALGLSLWPLLLFYFTLFTAPATLFLVVRFWNAPTSLLPRTRVRFVVAAVLALLQIAGWVAGVLAVIYAFRQRGAPSL